MNVSRAWEILKDKGYKKTDKRELILDMFAATDKYLTARDLLDVLKIFLINYGIKIKNYQEKPLC